MFEKRPVPAIALTIILALGSSACATGNGSAIEACGDNDYHPIEPNGHISTRLAPPEDWITVSELQSYAEEGDHGVDDRSAGWRTSGDDKAEKPGELFCYVEDDLKLRMDGLRVLREYHRTHQAEVDCSALQTSERYDDFEFDC